MPISKNRVFPMKIRLQFAWQLGSSGCPGPKLPHGTAGWMLLTSSLVTPIPTLPTSSSTDTRSCKHLSLWSRDRDLQLVPWPGHLLCCFPTASAWSSYVSFPSRYTPVTKDCWGTETVGCEHAAQNDQDLDNTPHSSRLPHTSLSLGSLIPSSS